MYFLFLNDNLALFYYYVHVRKSHTVSIGQSMQQFFSSAISLEKIDLSDCKLPAELAV